MERNPRMRVGFAMVLTSPARISFLCAAMIASASSAAAQNASRFAVLQAQLDDASCTELLRATKIRFEAATPPGNQSACQPRALVRLIAVSTTDGGEIAFSDKPLLACVMALRLSQFAVDFVAPMAAGLFAARTTEIATGPGLECRPRNRVPGAKMSAHGTGLAVDIASVTLERRRVLKVATSPSGGDNEQANRFFRALHAAGCGFFNTALGPAADSYHRDHLHFDLEQRGRGGTAKFCQ